MPGRVRLIAPLRAGTWLTASRIRFYCLVALGLYGVLFVAMALNLHGLLEPGGQPIGTDFSEVWVAGRSVLAGHPDAPFDPALHGPAQAAAFGLAGFYYGWHYPPFFLAVAAAAAAMPYLVALAVWQASSLLGYALAMRRILPGWLPMLAALAYPAVIVNVLHGQNGFLTAGLMAGAVLCLERRGLVAGVLFGLLAYKPQFGLAIPVAMIAAQRWRTVASAAATVAAMGLLSLAAFGVGTWAAFFRFSGYTRTVVLEQGVTGWFKLQSLFAAVRLWGGGIGLAYGLQAALAAMVLGVLWTVWRRTVDWRLQGAALLAAALLTTPYSLDYDLVLIGPALALLTAHGLEQGFLPWEKTLLAGAWASPLLARVVMERLWVPLGLAALACVFGLAAGRALAGAPGLGGQQARGLRLAGWPGTRLGR